MYIRYIRRLNTWLTMFSSLKPYKIYYFTIILPLFASAQKCQYIFDSPDITAASNVLKKILEASADTLRTEIETKDGKPTYQYRINLCNSIFSHDKKEYDKVGAIQQIYDDKTGEIKKNMTLGFFNSTDLISADNTLIVIYKGGENYSTACKNGPRQAKIIITCNSSEDLSQNLRFIGEHSETNSDVSDCAYYFQLGSKHVCTATPTPTTSPQPSEVGDTGISTGSVLVIMVVTVVCVYVVGGVLYRRLVVGAQGLDQIPHYHMWLRCGHLQADGCDFVCRRGHPRADEDGYTGVRGVDDDLVPPHHTHTDNDDHLLPM